MPYETSGAPAVILVEPQLGENIGQAARAMLNFGLTDMRLVRPRDGWPNAAAEANASGATAVIAAARVFETTEAAVGDLTRLYATTARPREIVKPVMTPAAAAAEIARAAARGERVGLLFGPERAGLTNDHVALADSIVTVPVNPAFASLNLAQAVLLVGYELFKTADATPPLRLEAPETRPATRGELEELFLALEAELVESGFLFPVEKRPSMVRNIRSIFLRAPLFEQDVRTLRGIFHSLARFGGGKGREIRETRSAGAARQKPPSEN